MVVGTGERALRIAKAIEKSAAYGVRLRGFFSEAEDDPGILSSSSEYKMYQLSELPAVLRLNVVDEIIFAVDSRKLAELEEVFLLCDQEGVRTRVAVDFFPPRETPDRSPDRGCRHHGFDAVHVPDRDSDPAHIARARRFSARCAAV